MMTSNSNHVSVNSTTSNFLSSDGSLLHEENISIPDNSICKLCLGPLNDATPTFVIESCQCRFCKQFYSDMTEIWNCLLRQPRRKSAVKCLFQGHNGMAQCMQCYAEVLIHDGVVLRITCPDADCTSSGVLNPVEIKELVQVKTFEMYERLKFEQEVAIDPHRTLCPEAMCSSVCHVCNSPSKVDQVAKAFPVSCPMCHLEFCYTCKTKWKPDHQCRNYPMPTTFGSEFQKFQAKTGLVLSDDATIKRCPVCNVLIEKNNGCAQMTCRNCSHIFCWYCLKVLDNDFLLRHYDKGPCRDKLGHSRSQIVRHRLGVVALFAAFFLLLVVASPVIFVAAPVILCYKCRKWLQTKNAPPAEAQTGLSRRRSNVVVEVRLNIHESATNTEESRVDLV